MSVTSVFTGIGSVTCIISTFEIAFRFHGMLVSLDKGNENSSFTFWIEAGFIATVIRVILLFVGTVLVSRQQVVRGIDWYALILVYCSVFRLVLMIYFIWGQVQVIHALKKTAKTAGILREKDEMEHLNMVLV